MRRDEALQFVTENQQAEMQEYQREQEKKGKAPLPIEGAPRKESVPQKRKR